MKILLILVILMQLFVLIGICRTNHKLNGFNDLILQDVGTNAKNTLNITRILNKLADAVIELQGKHKKHKNKKNKFYADNEIVKVEQKGAKFL